jgi:RND family efflux transporter MFP subunit
VGAGLAQVFLVAACHNAPEAAPAAAVAVTVATAGRADVSDLLSLRGRLVPTPEEDALLAPQVAGRILRLNVREGDHVAAGATVATIERQPLEDATRTAAAALAKARQDEAVREKAGALTASLQQKGIASVEERDNDRAALEAARSARVEAEARFAQAERQQAWAGLQAPFAGVVTQVVRRPGEIVDGTAATPVLRLLGTSAQEVSADATPADLARLHVDAVASTHFSGIERTFAGRVVRLAGAVDPATGVGEVRVRLTERSPAPLLSAASLSIVVAAHRGAIAVPLGALRRSEAGEDEVVLVERNAAKARAVKVGLRSATLAEIAEGLEEGDIVVVDSPLGLADGTALAVRSGKS